ncbi:SAV_2336 N-terminal domain-related protein [Streptomyces sp. NBC_01198]|uniref:SAV_2336 N-terminal domain-related protein n=1 Tax=Streptomyces sp. NBC_01198 TaxID=2903769 RepID=UPI002E125815|nr:SAV_2336 family protein [Streptomyces sp. NBC_01198]
MLDDLIRALRAAGCDADPVALADALWLAGAMAGSADGGGGDGSSGGEPAPRGDDSTARDPVGPAGPDELGGQPPPPAEGMDAFDSAGGVGGRPAVIRHAGRGVALPDRQAVARALRPLKLAFPRGREVALDAEATVRATVEARTLTPVLSPLPERWFHLDLVVDGSASMQVWQDVVGELQSVMEQLGAFSTVRRWSLDPAAPDGHPVRGPDGGPVRADRLCDAAGRRLVAVVSDCVAPGWRRPEVWQALRTWGRSTATVLLNPLPRRMWPHTGLDGYVVPLAAAGRGARTNDFGYTVPAALRVLAAMDPPDAAGGWMPCPVVGISADSVGAWAGTLMATGLDGCEGVLIPPGGLLPEPDGDLFPDADQADEPLPSVERLIDTFRRVSSPAAQRLAVLCSPFPTLSLPVLRTVQAALEPRSEVADLAELVVGGLFAHAPGSDSHDLRLCFRTGVQHELGKALASDDLWQVHFALSRFLQQETSQRGFRYAVADPLGDETIPDDLLPFAAASEATLRLLGDGAIQEGGEGSPRERELAVAGAAGEEWEWGWEPLLIRVQPRGADVREFDVEATILGRLLLAEIAGRQSQDVRSLVMESVARAEGSPGTVARLMVVVDLSHTDPAVPVYHWERYPGDPTHSRPLDAEHPVVVRWSPDSGGLPARRLGGHHRWELMVRARGRVREDDVYWAGDEDEWTLAAGLRDNPAVLCVVLDGPPVDRGSARRLGQLRTAVSAGVRAVIWNERRGDREAFRDLVRELLSRPKALPDALLDLRNDLLAEEGQPDLALLWNDPALDEERSSFRDAEVRELFGFPVARTYAVVVGVETYAAGTPGLDGPAHDACNAIEWLRKCGVPASHISALISPSEVNRAKVERAGVPTRDATLAEVEAVLFGEVSERRDDDLLLVFWSGHGFRDSTGESRLLLADGEPEAASLELGRTLAAFRREHIGFGRQLWFVDSCGGSPAALLDGMANQEYTGWTRPRTVGGTAQAVYLASGPEDNAQDIPGVGGLFSIEVMRAFRTIDPRAPIDPEGLFGTLADRFAELRRSGQTDQAPAFFRTGSWDAAPPPA